MNLLVDMWLLATRNPAVTVLCFVYSAYVYNWPMAGFLLLPALVHLGSAYVNKGDFMIRNVSVVRWAWKWTAIIFVVAVVVGVVVAYGRSGAPAEPDVFDWKDALDLLVGFLAGYGFIGIVAWTAVPDWDSEEPFTALVGAITTRRDAKHHMVCIMVLYAASGLVGNALLGLYMLAASAWVLRYMVGEPPERKEKAFKAVEGAA